MPFLDVSEILSDPDLSDTFDVTRSTQTVNSNGLASVTQATTTGIAGVVTFDKNYVLQRQAQGSHIEGAIIIHTTFRLTNGTGAADADIVTWNGRQYTVVMVSDWSRYGAGFVSATCDLLKLNP